MPLISSPTITANARISTATAGVWLPIWNRRSSRTQGTHKDMVIDFADFKGALRDLTEAFDHSFVVEEGSLAPDTLACLEREGFSLSVVPFRTTAENLARYFYGKLADAGFPVSQVDVYETPNNCAIYRG